MLFDARLNKLLGVIANTETLLGTHALATFTELCYSFMHKALSHIADIFPPSGSAWVEASKQYRKGAITAQELENVRVEAWRHNDTLPQNIPNLEREATRAIICALFQENNIEYDWGDHLYWFLFFCNQAGMRDAVLCEVIVDVFGDFLLRQSPIRQIRREELPALLELYRHLHRKDAPPPEGEALERLWDEILADPKLRTLVVELDGALVASCTLVLVPNLTRGGRPYGLIENVVTHADYRRRGLGWVLMHHALELAWWHGCYKVMLQTGRKDKQIMRFYERVGFKRGVKTGFVAYPPET